MLSKSSKWELGLVHYISKFTILRFVISRFECTNKSKGRWLTSLNGFLDKEFDTLSIKNTNILVRKLGKQLQKSVTRLSNLPTTWRSIWKNRSFITNLDHLRFISRTLRKSLRNIRILFSYSQQVFDGKKVMMLNIGGLGYFSKYLCT